MRQFLVFIFAMLAIDGFAQDSPLENTVRNRFSAAIGIGQLKEHNLARVIHQGLAVSLDYSRIVGNSNGINIRASYGSLSSSFEDFGSSHLAQFHLSYNQGFWKLKQDDFSLATAATVAADYRLAYLPNWDESHLYWANTWSVGACFSAKYALSSNQNIELQTRVPLVALISRPEAYRDYKIDDLRLGGLVKNFHGNTGFASWDKYFDLQNRFLYNRGPPRARLHRVRIVPLLIIIY